MQLPTRPHRAGDPADDRTGRRARAGRGQPPRRGVRRAIALAGCLVLLAAPAAAEGWRDRISGFGTRVGDVLAVPFDLVVYRPLAAVTTVIGAALFVPALAVGFANHRETLAEGFETMVVMPAQEVYERPLGEF